MVGFFQYKNSYFKITIIFKNDSTYLLERERVRAWMNVWVGRVPGGGGAGDKQTPR